MIDTTVRMLAVPGGVHAYLVQPLVPREQVLSVALASAPPWRAGAWLEQLVGAVCGAVDPQLGLDAQAGNWALDGDRLILFDVSTPLMRTHDGRDLLVMALFASVDPAALRPALRRVAHTIAAQYHDPRSVLVDVASNLHEERLDRCVPKVLTAAEDRVRPPIRQREVLRYFANGLLALFAFNRQSTLQIMPPLVIDTQEVLGRLAAAVADMAPG